MFIWRISMRQQLQAFIPIVLIALMVQILAPIGIARAAAAAAADPFRSLEICHSQSGSEPSDDDSRAKLDQGVCALCCLAQPMALDGPELTADAVPRRDARDLVWRAYISDVRGNRASSNAQARAPPAS
ncbi:conserved hypothetical protein; putative signal peptide [Bradyrhizobium sp. ORS 278]|nr:conserved hypothetical protein; putative signal peptide [Bradyrhizobium sp. ORS 278]